MEYLLIHHLRIVHLQGGWPWFHRSENGWGSYLGNLHILGITIHGKNPINQPKYGERRVLTTAQWPFMFWRALKTSRCCSCSASCCILLPKKRNVYYHHLTIIPFYDHHTRIIVSIQNHHLSYIIIIPYDIHSEPSSTILLYYPLLSSVQEQQLNGHGISASDLL